MKAQRNKTIDFSLEEGKPYLEKCIYVTEKKSVPEIINRTINGDTLSVTSFLPHKFVDLLIADPPYNMDKDFGGGKFKKMTESEYAGYTREWIEAVLPLLSDTASVYICCDWRTSIVIADVLREYFLIQNRITWQREKGRGRKENWKNSMEDIWFATVSKKFVFNVDSVMMRRRVLAPYRADGKPKDWEEDGGAKFRNTYPSNFWDDISIPYWSMPENTAHPTQKPEKLLAKLILASSNVNDVVFDPFLGSGSTSVTAKKLGRRYLGIEKNPLYCAWAEKRLSDAETDKKIQGYSDGVFWERNTLLFQKKKNNAD